MQILNSESEDPTSYETACLDGVFNLRRPPHRPSAVIQVTSTDDILEGVRLAHERKCQIAVRSGGHSMAVWSLHDGSILLDLGKWKELAVDPEKRIATATPSITSEELNDAAMKHGFVFPGGHCPDVGLGGFMLQGGMGLNARNWGWACESLEAVEVITAQGELLLCNAQQNEDLYWAARGGGPAFPGIVTKFHLQLRSAPAEGIRSSGYIYPRSLYRTAFEWVLSLIRESDHNTEVVMVAHYPGNSNSPESLRFLVYFVSMEATIARAQTILQQVQDTRPAGAITEWVCQEDSLGNLYGNQRKANPHSHYYYTDNVFLDDDVNVVATLEEAFMALPPGKSSAFWYPMYPHSRRTLPDMAFGMQSDHHFCIYSICEAESEAPRYRAWVDEVMARVRLHSVGAYIGESDCSMAASWYYGEERANRLAAICQKWDAGQLLAGPQSPIVQSH
ncbi:hypothetical protein ASPWEDRAFT_174886 [Aspergillus wentii DTO 134E9]|uniref:FAD-binding PCMH-type domain-containing protein n=1 Tax=Aspergillus wentii DTO 134E9 TaxID=1073089 RepID=A0A1L9REY6_ASPWE|nr:uncharacterized protein ASPWEDRAFT_174886 [Aspergillus wentii DTO 134E9]KAI9926163.1 hypothetical protein MW887_004626 [Aspergillus wentii]OJJ33482.1 hypothetical protein ASPWEDRAFT_174886 [Aspergillus wentii DTO 134E9]